MKLCENQNKVQRPGQQEDFLNSPAPFSSLSHRPVAFSHLAEIPLFTANAHLLVLLLLLLHQFVDLPLGHAGVLRDDAVLVQAGQQQQEAHCNEKNKKSVQRF